MSQQVHPESMAVAFFYWNGNHPERQDPQNVLGSLVRQLLPMSWLAPGSDHLEYLKALRRRHNWNNARLSSEELISIITRISKFFESIYILVDGLDECLKREDLVELIQTLAVEAHTVNIAVTSRPEMEFERAFAGRPCIRVGIDEFVDSDISIYIDWRLEHDVKLKSIRANRKHEIKRRLLSASQGM